MELEEIYNLDKYLPLEHIDPDESVYLTDLFSRFNLNYDNGKYDFAYLSLHLIFMSYVYKSIWTFREIHRRKFKHSLIGFNHKAKDSVMYKKDKSGNELSISLYEFKEFNESSIFHFFELFDIDISLIGSFKRLVKTRNELAHSSGKIRLNKSALNVEINNFLLYFKKINEKMDDLIIILYKNYLKNYDYSLVRDYLNDNSHKDYLIENIKDNFQKTYYLSQFDLNLIFDFEIKKEIKFSNEKLNKTYLFNINVYNDFLFLDLHKLICDNLGN
jgi:hypothetical protein